MLRVTGGLKMLFTAVIRAPRLTSVGVGPGGGTPHDLPPSGSHWRGILDSQLENPPHTERVGSFPHDLGPCAPSLVALSSASGRKRLVMIRDGRRYSGHSLVGGGVALVQLRPQNVKSLGVSLPAEGQIGRHHAVHRFLFGVDAPSQ